ncbi:Mpo1-like protein [Massilia sp. TWR1-2-2]|uniref:Mpo1-like protein n=1 Tax=Massilia sp. TWR1-2-2 TaxID=2804584 RepID=UPI003CE78449
MAARIATFAEFYPFYLTQHADRMCRRTHFIGSSLALIALAMLVVTGSPWWILAALVAGYGGAWIGHFVFEKNMPASFAQPLFSLRADWIMYWQMLTGKLSW